AREYTAVGKKPLHGNAAKMHSAVRQLRPWPARLLYRDYLSRPEAFRNSVEKFRESLVPYLRAWERHNVHFGASSWLSSRWIGTVYRRWYGSYAEFARLSLEEYARCFATTCLEFGPYHPPLVSACVRLRERVPRQFRFTVGIADESLMYKFPHGHPDPVKRGERNGSFLDAGFLEERVFPAVHRLGSNIGLLVLRLAPIYSTENVSPGMFLRQLDRFLGALPRDCRYAVEPGNTDYVLPEYLACLRHHGVAHVLRQRTGALPIIDQIQTPSLLTADRCLLRASPARNIREDDLPLGVVGAIRRALEMQSAIYIYVDDHSSFHAPYGLVSLMTLLNPELARLSPIKRRAA
ncbi:MAG: DUF72 domain-containing protein, partial [Bacteroidota bacterium]